MKNEKNEWNRGIRTRVTCRWMCQAAPLLATAVSIAGAERAEAYPVTFEFAGVVEQVFDANDLLGGAVEAGTRFSGAYTFESTTPDSRTDTDVEGFYEGALLSVSGEIGGIPFGADAPMTSFVRVRNDEPTLGVDAYSVNAGVNFLGAPLGFVLVLVDNTQSILEGIALPLIPPSLEMSSTTGFGLGAQEIGLNIVGPLTVLAPEPGTLALLGTGVFFALRRRRRQARCRDQRVHASALGLLVLIIVLSTSPAANAQQENCGCMDVVFLLDVTDSMTGTLANMQANLRGVIQNTAIPASGGDLRLGLITFNDPEIDAPPDSIRVWSALTTDFNTVLDQVDALAIHEGAARPEVSDEALREMLQAAGIGSGTICGAVSETRFDVPFRSHCVKHAILITDAPPRGKTGLQRNIWVYCDLSDGYAITSERPTTQGSMS